MRQARAEIFRELIVQDSGVCFDKYDLPLSGQARDDFVEMGADGRPVVDHHP